MANLTQTASEAFGLLLTSSGDVLTDELPGDTSIAVVPSVNPSVYGNLVTFTATVTPSTGGLPTGTVTFKDFAVNIGTDSLNGAAQAFNATSALTIGSHDITVVYAGDTNYFGSTSSILTQVVNSGPATGNMIVFTTMM